MRHRLVEAGLIDVEVAPGMTVPPDLSTRVAIRSNDKIQHRRPSIPTHHDRVDGRPQWTSEVYRVTFAHLGENLLTVHHGAGRMTHLEFFSTEPLETLIHKRAAFIAKHQVRDESKWYNGLLCEWAMDTHVQLGPDNYDRIKSWRVYEVTCDDPGLSKPAYLASKNAEFPDAAAGRGAGLLHRALCLGRPAAHHRRKVQLWHLRHSRLEAESRQPRPRQQGQAAHLAAVRLSAHRGHVLAACTKLPATIRA